MSLGFDLEEVTSDDDVLIGRRGSPWSVNGHHNFATCDTDESLYVFDNHNAFCR